MRERLPLSWSLTLALIIGAGWIWYSRVPPDNVTTGRPPAPQIGFASPDFNLMDMDGHTVKLADLRGRPVVINFWASWCRPCQAEMPALERVYQDLQTQGVEILAVNTTFQDDPTRADEFTRGMSLTFPILLDQDGQVSERYHVRAMPTTFFVNRQGIIQDIVIGGPMAEALLRIRIEQLLGSGDAQGEAR